MTMSRGRFMVVTGLGFAVVFSIGAMVLQSRKLSKFIIRKVPVPAFYEDLLLSPTFRGPPVGPPYYTYTRNDRSGMIITEMLNAYAYCFRNNRIYAGSCPDPKRNGERPPHEAEAITILQALGLYNNDTDQTYEGMQTASPLRFMHACPTNTGEGVLLDRELYHTHVTKRIWTPAFVRKMQGLVRVPTKSSLLLLRNDGANTTTIADDDLDDLYTVAVHIRRGDVHPCHHKGRYLPNSHYLRLLRLYLPPQYRDETRHKVFVFSQEWSFENFTSFEASAYNVELVLDSDLAPVWQTMAAADLVILSKSTFSLVPAMLNGKGTVVYTRFPRSALPGWIVAPTELSVMADAEVQRMADQFCTNPQFNPWLGQQKPS